MEKIIVLSLILILLIFGISYYFSENNTSYRTKKENTIMFDYAADFPKQFGYKISWLVIKEKDAENIIKELDLNDKYVANWNSGINAIYNNNDYIFITPSINNYVCIIGNDLINSNTVVQKLTKKFNEVFLCESYRTIDLYCWQKYINGNLIRTYCYLGEEGTVISEGSLTSEEIKLGFDKLIQNNDELLKSENINHPTEEDVINISKEWGFDTTFTNYSSGASTGYVCIIN